MLGAVHGHRRMRHHALEDHRGIGRPSRRHHLSEDLEGRHAVAGIADVMAHRAADEGRLLPATQFAAQDDRLFGVDERQSAAAAFCL